MDFQKPSTRYFSRPLVFHDEEVNDNKVILKKTTSAETIIPTSKVFYSQVSVITYNMLQGYNLVVINKDTNFSISPVIGSQEAVDITIYNNSLSSVDVTYDVYTSTINPNQTNRLVYLLAIGKWLFV